MARRRDEIERSCGAWSPALERREPGQVPRQPGRQALPLGWARRGVTRADGWAVSIPRGYQMAKPQGLAP